MTETTVHELAQVNIARLKAPLDSPPLKDFVDSLDPVNADADTADGFVWRLQGEEGDATDIAVFGDSWLIINMSVWRDTDALTAFMYQGRHRELLARRREWFERVEEAMTTLWWIPKGHRPTVAEAESRLLHLRTHGPTPHAFTLRTSFPPGSPALVPGEVPERPGRPAQRTAVVDKSRPRD
ncbi:MULTISPECIES: DUF3291 domain-containing protein [Streptomyces]|jgi:hypothetical protein|uniref:DUF3291 domain-containing protein n=1 Tax=Streptomyces edwardsiae TaxID=3075527 RepID=A0ABU2Q7Q0_9ACTN|nr:MULTISPECIES: DUF3291 domain-containing protein [unclassified Streptomyces]MDT0394400.1 DUF3291 domain-containing protein [Streptomyces sp. DSM 41636]MDT0400389.1 DUF3291 domain-containing protein [Streptomyces sp. DSM 41635]